MSFITDLGSALGFPAGLIVAMSGVYKLGSLAEKKARPAQLEIISEYINSSAESKKTKLVAVVYSLFLRIFGERQFTKYCFITSMLSSIFVSLTVIIWSGMYEATFNFSGKTQLSLFTSFVFSYKFPLYIFFIGVIPDFIAIWKTRIILRVAAQQKTVYLIFWVLVDAAASLILSLMFITIFWVLFIHDYNKSIAYIVGEVLLFTPLPAFPISTLFTSAWVFLVATAAILLKIFNPIFLFTGSFFLSEKYPITAICIVADVCLFLATIVWYIFGIGHFLRT